MIRLLIENISVPHVSGRAQSVTDELALEMACRKARRLLSCSCTPVGVYKKSIDARRRSEIKLVYSVMVSAEIKNPNKEKLKEKGIKLYCEPEFTKTPGDEALCGRPVIIGFGPAGIFCAIALARAGYEPIVYERGGDVDERVCAVNEFYRSGKLNTESSIQFGAGGAGTFSDGKLTTRVNDPLCAYVTSELVALGAPEDIAWKAKPHIGTDILRQVVKNADSLIREMGGEVRYNSKVSLNGEQISVNGEAVDYGVAVVAVGHSARDTYSELMSSGYAIEPKPFSVGVRIEHLTEELDRAMHGDFAGDETLGHAEYNLSHRGGDRGVYSFCMCPGGEVVAAASEKFGVVTNGMSRRARDGRNSNAAIAVSVHPSDYGSTPDGAISFQRELEKRAFNVAGETYAAPVQSFGDFCSGRCGELNGRIVPTYMDGNVVPCDLNRVLPTFVCEMLKEGIADFGRKIVGFDAPDVPLTGVETRTSAPVRILRRENLTAFGHERIYPCGEGAGYAGGIMSAALDGLRVAGAIIERYSSK